MKIAIDKKVLFNFLKSKLNENYDSDELGFYEEDEDLPIDANPAMDFSIEDEDKSLEDKLTDPDYSPASIAELAQVAKIFAQHVENNPAIIIKYYQGLHDLMDKVHDSSSDDEDEEEESEEKTISESINISKKTTIKDFNILIESSDETEIKPEIFDSMEQEFGEYLFTFDDGKTTVINFDGFDLQEAIIAVEDIAEILISKHGDPSFEELANAKSDASDLLKKGYNAGERALASFGKQVTDLKTQLPKILQAHVRKTKDRELLSLRKQAFFLVGFRMGVIAALELEKTAMSMSDDEVDTKFDDAIKTDMSGDLSLPTEKEVSDIKKIKLANVEANKELYDDITSSEEQKLVNEAAHIVTSTFYLVMNDLAKEDNARYMALTAFDGWKNPEQYADKFKLHAEYEVNFNKKILSSSDQQRFVFNVIDNPVEAKKKFIDFINKVLIKHFFDLGKNADKLRRLNEIATKLRESNLPLVDKQDKTQITVESLIGEVVAGMAETMYKNACKMSHRDPENGEVIQEAFLKNYVRQQFGKSRNSETTVEKYNDYFLPQGKISRRMKKYREITFFNMMDENDVDPLTEILLESIYEKSISASDNPEKIIVKITRVTLDPERPNYSEQYETNASDLANAVREHFVKLAEAAKDVQQARIEKVEATRKKYTDPTPEEIRAMKKKEKEKKKKTYKGLGRYLEQNSDSGGRQEFLKAPNYKYLLSGAPQDNQKVTDVLVGFDFDSEQWLFVDFMDSVYDLVTPILLKKVDALISKMQSNPSVPEIKKGTGFIKKSSNMAVASFLYAAKEDLTKINDYILVSGFESVDYNNEFYKLMYSLGGFILRDLVGNIVNDVLLEFINDLKAQVSGKLKRILPKVSFLDASDFSNDDLDELSEYFIGLKNRPTRLDFVNNKRNTRRWTAIGLDFSSFEALFQTIYDSEIAGAIVGFYQSTIPVLDEEGEVIEYKYDEDEVPDEYPQKAQEIIAKLKSSDEFFEDAIKKALANYQNYQKTKMDYDDDNLTAKGV